jgi:hypothetical protein
MAKPEWLGLAVLGCGAIFGFALGGTLGLAIASACLIVGLVLFVASEALSHGKKPATPAVSEQPATHILVLLKEVHVRPQRAGKFQEISDPNQDGLQFEIFVHCWLVNDTDEQLGIAAVKMSLTSPGGMPVLLERIGGDLESWRLGRLRDEVDSWGVRYLQAGQESLAELRTEEPLNGGSTRQGWLHLRAEGLTPGQMKNAKLELEVVDSHLRSHLGDVNGPHQIPGRIWPFRVETAALPSSNVVTAVPDAPRPALGQTP